jgi:Tfp pilus assembly protein PilX
MFHQTNRFSGAAVAKQQGATLIVALIVLVLIMMLGVAAMTSSSTQYKLAGNLQFEDGAMNNAEAAAIAAEKWLESNYQHAAFTTPDNTMPHLFQKTSVVDPFSYNWESNSMAVANTSQRYIIQIMSNNSLLQGSSAAVGRSRASVCNKVNTYLITARGTSARGATKLVQSYYSVFSC